MQRCLPSINKSLSLIDGNTEILPFEDNAFDLCTIAFGLCNVTHTDKASQESFRVLKPGGRYMYLEFSHIVNCTILKQIYYTHSFHTIPVISQIVTNDRDSYQYLVESIRTFYT